MATWRPRQRTTLVALPVLIGLIVIALPTTLEPPRVAATVPPTVAGCPTLPADNIWNARVDQLPVHPRSAQYLSSMGLSTGLHADFGSGTWNGGPIGIPYVTVPGTQPKVPVTFQWPDESDPGPYPIPPNPAIEGGASSTGDRHVLVVDRDNCVLYELYSAYPNADGSWQAGSGAIFPLRSNGLRPQTWTSADAAGLPMLPGLARYDEVSAGQIAHALRFTAAVTQRAYVWPARHYASSNTSLSVPPMGTRVRLKASFDVSHFSPANQVILRALQTYGMILADNGSNWYISGEPDARWNNTDLHALGSVIGSSFEVVDESSLMVQINSGQAASSGQPAATATPTPSSTAAVGATATPSRTPPAGTTATATSTRPAATSTATATVAASPTATQPAAATHTSTPTGPTMQVADLDGSVAAEGTNWKARVSILVQTGDGRPLPGANVQGAWGGGYTGTVSCWTANNGRCTVSTGRVPGQSATFTVTGLTKSGVTYQPAANHDPDGDSNGTTITIVRH